MLKAVEKPVLALWSESVWFQAPDNGLCVSFRCLITFNTKSVDAQETAGSVAILPTGLKT